VLEGRHIILRLFREEDIDEFVTLYNRYSERGEFFSVALRSTMACRNEFRENGWWGEHDGRMLITDKQGRMLGTIFFFKGAPFQEGYEVGYTLFRRADRGHGVMSEALPIFSAYLFEAKPIQRLALHAPCGNSASQRVAEKSGYRHEGTLRQSFFMRGEYHDCEAYALLRVERPLVDLARSGQEATRDSAKGNGRGRRLRG
jgi:[ribosomal protein S5]-alanine N-acetyltransferase